MAALSPGTYALSKGSPAFLRSLFTRFRTWDAIREASDWIRTVTLQVAFFPDPSLAETVMTVVPLETAVTLPEPFTVAAFGLELFQMMDLFVALRGKTDADKR